MPYKKAKLKTQKNDASVENYINSIKSPSRKEDCVKINNIMTELTGQKPQMWGASIVGYGEFTYVSPKTGRSGDWVAIGWSNRVKQITIYIMNGFKDYDDLLSKLGKHTTSKSCLYIKSLDDIDTKILQKLIKESYKIVTSGATFEY
ncbi:MAG: DUF1801 domain-containing protein [bacterium]|nr:DUF1801 domain-containing protein [bacterium]